MSDPHVDGGVRLQKVLARTGIGSRRFCESLIAHGILAKDTHGATIRLAPPLVVTEAEVDLLVTGIGRALAEFRRS